MKGYSDLVGHSGKGLNKKNLKNIAKLAKQKNDKLLMKLLSDLKNVNEGLDESFFNKYKVGDIVIFPQFAKNKLKKHHMRVLSVLDKRGAVPDQELTVVIDGKMIYTPASAVELLKKKKINENQKGSGKKGGGEEAATSF